MNPQHRVNKGRAGRQCEPVSTEGTFCAICESGHATAQYLTTLSSKRSQNRSDWLQVAQTGRAKHAKAGSIGTGTLIAQPHPVRHGHHPDRGFLSGPAVSDTPTNATPLCPVAPGCDPDPRRCSRGRSADDGPRPGLISVHFSDDCDRHRRLRVLPRVCSAVHGDAQAAGDSSRDVTRDTRPMRPNQPARPLE